MTPTATTTVSLYGFVTPKPGHADALRALLTGLVEPSRAEDGNLEYHVHEQEDGRFFLYEVWRSPAALEQHHATPFVRAFLAEFPDHAAGAPEAYSGVMVSPYPARAA
ncbi:putative quinol monooxygenase [Cryptosporangium minutisporangium]|uniref:Quinol monooxygenase n=1 Tax=Cryptosporangium minutisporangium TaxID=113569 RepID=A0ABP6TC76_9ACTN